MGKQYMLHAEKESFVLNIRLFFSEMSQALPVQIEAMKRILRAVKIMICACKAEYDKAEEARTSNVQ